MNALAPVTTSRSETYYDDLHETALKQYSKGYDHKEDDIREGMEDARFAVGEQWDEAVRREREREGRPCITANQIPAFVERVTGNMRENPPSIKVRPKNNKSYKDTAMVLDGIIRNILDVSSAHEITIDAAANAVRCSQGNWRIVLDYDADDSLDVQIKLARINNPFAVIWDPDANELDNSDAMWCFVTQRMTKEAFEERYPDADATSFEERAKAGDYRNYQTYWQDQREVQVAEYWYKKPYKKTLARLEDGATIDITDFSEEEKFFIEPPITEEVERDAYKVCRVVMSGSAILEEEQEWPGRDIPIVSVWGQRVNVGDRSVTHGLVRFMRDPQAMYNYWRSTDMEIAAFQSKAPWLVTDKMVEEYAPMWNTANRKNHPYLKYKVDPTSPTARPERVQPPVSSQASGEQILHAKEEMRSVTGIYDAALGGQSNEQSGKAINARTRQSDTSNFVYYDNFASGMRYTGKILMDLIPKVYTGQRTERLLGEDGTESYEDINVEVRIGDEVYYHNDLTIGEYDASIQTGPSYASLKQESQEVMIELMGMLPPEQAGLISYMVAGNLEVPNADKIADILKKTVPPELLGQEESKDEELEGQEQPAAPPPDPLQEAAMQSEMQTMQLQVEEQAAKTQQAQAEAQKSLAEVEKVKNDILLIQAKVAETRRNPTVGASAG